jgi:hypothetical protein
VTRSMTVALATDVAAERAAYVHLFQLAFSGGTVNYTNASQDIAALATTWTAIGGALAFSAVTEAADLSSGGTDLILSGVDRSIITTLLANQYIGRNVSVWLAHLTPASGVVVADPVKIFSGVMNGGWSIRETWPTGNGPGTCTVTGRMVNRMTLLEQRRGIQTNVAGHQALYPGDLFFSYTGRLVAAGPDIKWGA